MPVPSSALPEKKVLLLPHYYLRPPLVLADFAHSTNITPPELLLRGLRPAAVIALPDYGGEALVRVSCPKIEEYGLAGNFTGEPGLCNLPANLRALPDVRRRLGVVKLCQRQLTRIGANYA